MAESSGRAAIVTGSDSGIGKATAVALAAQGCDVGITWHDDRDGAEATDVVDEVAEALGGVDVLVNDAGTGHSTPLLDLDLATSREVLATSPVPRGRSTAGCRRWARWPART
jgi:NAD(P)-dependent dehydrogenase (short-subunit alcohol dehydrogenase family)